MICPKYKAALITRPDDKSYERIREGDAECDREQCGQWDEKNKQCCILTLSQLRITGGINTHPY